MGSCCSTSEEDREARQKILHTDQIDAQLKRQEYENKKEVKLLLLGPGESGKSTVFKQMKIIQTGGGFSQQEMISYKPIIYANIITQIRVLLISAAKSRAEFGSEENNRRATHLLQLSATDMRWSPSLADAIKHLWKDKAVQNIYQQRDTNFVLNDSAFYYFENLERIADENYIPTEQDILRARARTSCVEESTFTFDDFLFKMVDVGGQRSERRKWIHHFDCVTAVIFCASLSEYDQNLREDQSQNRMRESLLLFDEICNSSWFRDVAFILFLNKTDILKEKLSRGIGLGAFPEYNGPLAFDDVTNFIREKFLTLNTSPHPVYCHLTCAISTDNMRFVFRAVREVLVKKALVEIF